MFNMLKRLYNKGNGKLTKDGLKKAITFEWITPEQYKGITEVKKDV